MVVGNHMPDPILHVAYDISCHQFLCWLHPLKTDSLESFDQVRKTHFEVGWDLAGTHEGPEV